MHKSTTRVYVDAMVQTGGMIKNEEKNRSEDVTFKSVCAQMCFSNQNIFHRPQSPHFWHSDESNVYSYS